MSPSQVDSRVASLVDNRDGDSDDEDALLAALEEDDDHALSALREQRMQQLHDEVLRSKVMREAGTGSYQEIKDEKEVLDITTGTKLCVVHFFKPDFGRCGVMDGHLEVSLSAQVHAIHLYKSCQRFMILHYRSFCSGDTDSVSNYRSWHQNTSTHDSLR